MNWIELTESGSLEQIKEISKQRPIVIFKHSTRCSISSMALNRLERGWKEDEVPNIDAYFLDLIRHREVSNAIEGVFGVPHQSPQVLVISGGKCIHTSSHMGISFDDIKERVLQGTESMN